MPDYEGVVNMIRDDGTADVLVVPERSFIPGASDLNVCHCATVKSSVQARAFNMAGAKVGDLASLHLDAGPLARNLAAFLMLPASGALAGLLIGIPMPWWWSEMVFALAGLLAGLFAGIWIRGKKKQEHLPVIVKIIFTSTELKGNCGAGWSEGCSGCGEGRLRGIET